MTREAELWLGPERTGAAEARRFVRRIFDAWRLPAELCESAESCTSELVANASLHARTDVYVRALLSGGVVRIEVRDEAPGDLPSRLSRAAATPGTAARGGSLPLSIGRGLLVVDGLSDAWGVAHDGRGKTAWFELRTATAGGGQDTRPAGHPAPGVRRVTLVDLPVALAVATDESLQELLREAELAAPMRPGGRGPLAAALQRFLDRYGAIRNALWHAARQAAEQGASRMTVTVELPSSAVDDGPQLLRVLEEADAMCLDGTLLALPAPAEVSHFRRWLIETLAALAKGPADEAVCPFGD